MDEFKKVLKLEILSSYRCPITSLIMIDPVTCTDGHSYEREAIQDWLDCGNNTSPLTNQMLTSTNLIPNHTLRKSIEEFVLKNKEVKSSGEIYVKKGSARQKRPMQPVYSDWDPIKLGDAPELEYDPGTNPEVFQGEEKGNNNNRIIQNSYDVDNVKNSSENSVVNQTVKITEEPYEVRKINFEKSVESGLWYFRHGFYRKAHTIFVQIKKQYPSNLYVQAKICSILKLNGEEILKKIIAREVVNLCDQQLASNKNNLDAKIAKGIALLVLEEYQKCVGILNRAITEKPTPTHTQFSEIYYYIGISYQIMFNSDGLFQVAKQMKKFDKEDIMTWRFLANSYIVKGKKKQALSIINDRLKKLKPKYPYHEYIFLSSLNRENPKLCYYYANEALKMNNLNRNSLVQLQFAIFQLKEYKKLLEWCLYTLKLYPNCIASWLNYGVALGHLGNPEQSIRVYNQILRINPNYYLAKINKCKHIVELKKDYHQVIHICDSLTKTKKKIPKHHLTLLYINKSCALIKLGRKSEARTAAQKALKLEPNNKRALTNYEAAGGIGTGNNCIIS